MTREHHLIDLMDMWRIRVLEEKAAEFLAAGQPSGAAHVRIGQEAGPVGACSELGPEDALFATHRGHGWALQRGVPAHVILAETLSRATGVHTGRGASTARRPCSAPPGDFTPQYGFYGETAGTGLPIAVGAAMAGRFGQSNRVSMTVFGDEALREGRAQEAVNMAAAFRLPVVFICEEDVHPEVTPSTDTVIGDQPWMCAAGCGMDGSHVDGQDPVAVRAACRLAVERARAGEGPTLLVLTTERPPEHRTGHAGETDQWSPTEPITRLAEKLRASGVADQAIAAAEETARNEIETACDHALANMALDPAKALAQAQCATA
ncbi:thiamine pyrophosphate-dependent dehydrogenase E1 component subunit alpha [Actinomadura madurae]|uniref:thiamine pyrophosphate-dependent dehydrogenase E1 component subunit alpha n=1 Tax=Actinomadura madurae TaxID=1993 RepID=UPI000D9AD1CC|nr:thiamine pyrophosphate-dependent dehydrogenase E1 component subunit alpha [Actinomadura madurae]SPT59089.1 Acetoin:2,6-dichlorophenolindophenol oxidoreductase subunit alpha [Actinomadura madurae]